MSESIPIEEVIGSALRRARDPRVLAATTLAAAGNVALTWALRAAGFAAGDTPGPSIENIAIAEVTYVIAVLPTAIGHAWASNRVLTAERPNDPPPPPSLEIALRVYLGEIGLHLALTLALMACLLPALVVVTLLAVLTPVIVAERAGPLRAAARSRELVAGRAAHVAVVVLLAQCLMLIVIVVCELPVTLPLVQQSGVGMRAFLSAVRRFSATDDPTTLFAQFVARSLYGAIWMGVTNVLYLRLLRRDEPGEIETVARVFE